jgi:hypothetical protein
MAFAKLWPKIPQCLDSGQERQVSRALVTVGPDIVSAQPAGGDRANAGFLALLIAHADKLPQTRARRRAAPQEAVAAYAALGQWPTPAGRKLSRFL